MFSVKKTETELRIIGLRITGRKFYNQGKFAIAKRIFKITNDIEHENKIKTQTEVSFPELKELKEIETYFKGI